MDKLDGEFNPLDYFARVLRREIELHIAERAKEGLPDSDDVAIHQWYHGMTHGTIRAWIKALSPAVTPEPAKEEGCPQYPIHEYKPGVIR